MAAKHRHQLPKKWSEEWGEIISGVSGGFLFGIPLLCTMEVWFIGSYAEPPILLGIIAITFFIVFLINRVEGFRSQADDKDPISKAIAESIETLSIGFVCATLIMIVLQEINLQTPLDEVLGKVVFEAMPFSFGVALSRSILDGDRYTNSNSNQSQSHRKGKKRIIWADTVADLSGTILGAMFVAFSIAPTDEVAMLAAPATPPWLLLIIFSSLIITYGIVFASGFTNQNKRRQQQGIFQRPESETLVYYLVSLFVSALMLWFFQRLAFDDPWSLWMRYSIILSLPASIGGAAGRLAV
ncbi:integral membrane protein TIGR02587 [Stanieria cyanosphaera PCC 7437]|uniref:Integral membrane protein TIGR02587 n=1 Tax=Stanieria cyanosphaera (strain ATCC 29371 / PCC 7437) TaxID=111780 RepID=K9XRC5_STAC7|nr:TIGR02587 family membrane protein [Stanieria cyanosphaera]AFZ35170.1 integral membrane protein TIGR02587 [Stanieria cyanosphaera PCC 7437]